MSCRARLSKLQSRRRRGRMTGGRKGRTFYNVCSCRRARARARQRRRQLQQHETMSPLETPSPMQLVPSFPAAFSEWLILPSSGTNALQWERREDKPPHGTLFSRASSSFFFHLSPSFLLFLLSGSLSRWMGLRLRRTGWKGFPFIPTLLSRRSGVIAKGEDHVALKGILVVSVFSLFA